VQYVFLFCDGAEPLSDKPCQLNRSMQHYLIRWSDDTSSMETICKAVLNQNLNRAVFRSHQRPRTNLPS